MPLRRYNPISDSRLPNIRSYIIKWMVGYYNELGATRRAAQDIIKPYQDLIHKETIGLFKIRVYSEPKEFKSWMEPGYDPGHRYVIFAPAEINEYNDEYARYPRVLGGDPGSFVSAENKVSPTDDRDIQHTLLLLRRSFEDVTTHIESSADHLLRQLKDADPTHTGEYARWIAKQVIEENLRFPEDIEKVNDDLTGFHGIKARKVLPKEHRDINKFATYGEFFEILKQFGGVLSDREKVARAMESGNTIYESETYRVIEVKKWQLAKHLAQGTGWCVRGTDMAQHYLQEPEKYPLYFFFRDGEQYGLLSSRPDEPQFKDVNDVEFTKEAIEEDSELVSILPKICDWIVCVGCGTVYAEKFDLDRFSDELSELTGTNFQSDRPIPVKDTGVTFGVGSYLVFQSPPAISNYPVITTETMLNDKVMLGPARGVLKQIADVKFPAIDKFFEKAGISNSADIVRDITKRVVEPLLCSCGGLDRPIDAGEVRDEILHALFVIQPCEDFGVMSGYVVCGHDLSPKYRGPACPARLMDWGPFVGMRCVCGVFVPYGSRFSICPACLRDDEPTEYYTGRPLDEDEQDDLNWTGDYPKDGCPLEELSQILSSTLPKWRHAATFKWDFSYDPKLRTGHSREAKPKWHSKKPPSLAEKLNLRKSTEMYGYAVWNIRPLPRWHEFAQLHVALYQFPEFHGLPEVYFSPEFGEFLSEYRDLFEAVNEQQYFDKEAFMYLLDAFENISSVVKKIIKTDPHAHNYCCEVGT